MAKFSLVAALAFAIVTAVATSLQSRARFVAGECTAVGDAFARAKRHPVRGTANAATLWAVSVVTCGLTAPSTEANIEAM